MIWCLLVVQVLGRLWLGRACQEGLPLTSSCVLLGWRDSCLQQLHIFAHWREAFVHLAQLSVALGACVGRRRFPELAEVAYGGPARTYPSNRECLTHAHWCETVAYAMRVTFLVVEA